MQKFKKSEIAIYVIALMLVAAGYFNYNLFEPKSKETFSSDVTNEASEYANIGDAVLVSNQEVQQTEENKNDEGQNQNKEGLSEETSIEPEETKTQENLENEDYYTSSKLERNKMYAEMVTNYENIISNNNSSEVQKSIATEEIKKINNNKNAIMICENLILTKGFENCVIFINENSVNVVVKIKGGLNTEKVAVIQNIISRELSCEIANIHIAEV